MAYDMYQEKILFHYRNPKNFGELPAATLSGEESNPLCGDRIRLALQLDAAGKQVQDVRFSGDGCAISVASTSMLTQKVQGQKLEDIGRITRDDVLAMLGIPLSPVRVKCALIGFVALGRALHGLSSSRAPEAGTPT